MIIRIFLPKTVYRVESIDSSKCYHIFGKILNDSWGDNLSIFVIGIRERDAQTTPDRQLIGMISKTIDVEHLPNDYVTFKVDGIKSILEIKNLCLPNFIATGTSFNTQIFLYDSGTFTELARRHDEQPLNQRQDPISQLLLLIKNRDEFTKKPHLNIMKDDRNPIISFLMALSLFCETKLAFLNSSFLRHFQFWASNLEKLTHKK